jgi:hypothetical protein
MAYVNVNPYVTSLSSGTIDGHTISGHGGTQTIYGDAYTLYGRVTAHSNSIDACLPGADDSSAVSTIYGNAYVMGRQRYPRRLWKRQHLRLVRYEHRHVHQLRQHNLCRLGFR